MSTAKRNWVGAIRAVAALGALACAGILIYSFEPEGGGGLAALAAFLLWGVSPYAFVAGMTLTRLERGGAIVVLIATGTFTLLGTLILVDDLFFAAEGQLAVIFVPGYQWIGWVFATIVARIVSRTERDRLAQEGAQMPGR